MSKRRERLQVIYDILKVLDEKGGSARPTHILYKSNLSHKMMEQYLKELMGKGFVIQELASGGKVYSLTAKGRDFLGKYSQIVEFIDSFGLA